MSACVSLSLHLDFVCLLCIFAFVLLTRYESPTPSSCSPPSRHSWASRFDQLLALTDKICTAVDNTSAIDARAQLIDALALLKAFLATNHHRQPHRPANSRLRPHQASPIFRYRHHWMALQKKKIHSAISSF